MPTPTRIPDPLVRTAQFVTRLATRLNWTFLVAVIAGLVISLAIPALFTRLLLPSIRAADLPSALAGARLTLLIGIAMALASARLLSALTSLLASARTGNPFAGDNAHRLQTIGWCLLFAQVLEFPAALVGRFYPGLGDAAPHGDFSLAGWMSVLMVFVLSRVFDVGAVMRDELDGTV
jgi:Protein of unknown function (DUF2975)